MQRSNPEWLFFPKICFHEAVQICTHQWRTCRWPWSLWLGKADWLWWREPPDWSRATWASVVSCCHSTPRSQTSSRWSSHSPWCCLHLHNCNKKKTCCVGSRKWKKSGKWNHFEFPRTNSKEKLSLWAGSMILVNENTYGVVSVWSGPSSVSCCPLLCKSSSAETHADISQWSPTQLVLLERSFLEGRSNYSLQVRHHVAHSELTQRVRISFDWVCLMAQCAQRQGRWKLQRRKKPISPLDGSETFGTLSWRSFFANLASCKNAILEVVKDTSFVVCLILKLFWKANHPKTCEADKLIRKWQKVFVTFIFRLFLRHEMLAGETWRQQK